MRKLKLIILAAAAAAALAGLCACKSAMPFEYDEQAAIKRAKEVVDVVNSRDYEKVYSLFREDLRDLTSAESLKSGVDPVLEKAGAFKEYGEAQTAGQRTKEYGDCIIVVLKSKYEKTDLVYTVSFDTDFNLIGLYVK